jgi:hypothetical protein
MMERLDEDEDDDDEETTGEREAVAGVFIPLSPLLHDAIRGGTELGLGISHHDRLPLEEAASSSSCPQPASARPAMGPPGRDRPALWARQALLPNLVSSGLLRQPRADDFYFVFFVGEQQPWGGAPFFLFFYFFFPPMDRPRLPIHGICNPIFYPNKCNTRLSRAAVGQSSVDRPSLSSIWCIIHVCADGCPMCVCPSSGRRRIGESPFSSLQG